MPFVLSAFSHRHRHSHERTRITVNSHECIYVVVVNVSQTQTESDVSVCQCVSQRTGSWARSSQQFAEFIVQSSVQCSSQFIWSDRVRVQSSFFTSTNFKVKVSQVELRRSSSKRLNKFEDEVIEKFPRRHGEKNVMTDEMMRCCWQMKWVMIRV